MIDWDARDVSLADDGLIIVTLPVGWTGVRMHRASRDPAYFGNGTPLYRFDDPGPAAAVAPHWPALPIYASTYPNEGAFGVCYVGVTPEAAFVETFFPEPSRRAVAEVDLRARRLSVARMDRAVRLVGLMDSGLLRAQTDGSATSGLPYDYSQAVARCLWRHPARVDGILYRARHDQSEMALALFDRARDAVVFEDPQAVTDVQLKAWVARWNFALV